MLYATTPDKVPALSRTWEVFTEFRACGEYWGNSTCTVTLDKTSGILRAEINGEPADLHRAVSLLEGATRTTLIREVKRVPASMLACLGISA